MQGSYTSLLLGPQIFQIALHDMRNIPERENNSNYSTLGYEEYEDYQIRDWDQDYLSKHEEEHWQTRDLQRYGNSRNRRTYKSNGRRIVKYSFRTDRNKCRISKKSTCHN
ncbi:uncharacterized protein [Miscanthus floridulus]|uniref:uncharacterized protein n=1 Tax=Miscanthus floridulus TaxID=154761 RepID=UPI0034598F7D